MTRLPFRPTLAVLAAPALVALVSLGAFASGLEAQQPRRPGARAQERPQLERQLRQRFQQMVARELGLGEDQAVALDAAVAEFQEPRAELARRQIELRRRMTGTGALLSEDEAVAVLDEILAVKEEEARLMAEEQTRLLQVLSPPQVVRFHMLREQLANRIRQLRENRRGGGGPGAWPTGGTPGIWPVLGS